MRKGFSGQNCRIGRCPIPLISVLAERRDFADIGHSLICATLNLVGNAGSKSKERASFQVCDAIRLQSSVRRRTELVERVCKKANAGKSPRPPSGLLKRLHIRPGAASTPPSRRKRNAQHRGSTTSALHHNDKFVAGRLRHRACLQLVHFNALING
jgi:hypothetical protein